MPPVFDDPVAEPRGAAGGRTIIISSVRRDHLSIAASAAPIAPSFAPNRIPHSAKKKLRRRPAAAQRRPRRQRVALLTDVAGSARPSRTRIRRE
jgi:hypothetical protein